MYHFQHRWAHTDRPRNHPASIPRIHPANHLEQQPPAQTIQTLEIPSVSLPAQHGCAWYEFQISPNRKNTETIQEINQSLPKYFLRHGNQVDEPPSFAVKMSMKPKSAQNAPKCKKLENIQEIKQGRPKGSL
mmetsp:Transcript_19944/g.32862  ORF Transcript_19944/g.32862 Transcript_19944/m.32862 type:complete len:132 (-) Transcript_19944:57-452(-)